MADFVFLLDSFCPLFSDEGYQMGAFWFHEFGTGRNMAAMYKIFSLQEYILNADTWIETNPQNHMVSLMCGIWEAAPKIVGEGRENRMGSPQGVKP